MEPETSQSFIYFSRVNVHFWICFDGSSYSFASCIQIEFSDVNYSCCRRSYNGSNCGNCIDSISQLNHYHKALHEDERFLSSVNLLGKFSTVEARDDMLREIIRSEIQMNLAVIHENVKSDSSSIKENSKK